nr:amino acid ABC transporter substrate-binding protein [Stutzerimonas stutzeri]
MLVLSIPVSVHGAPLQAALVDGYRPFKATADEPLSEGFEAAWLKTLAERLGRSVSLAGSVAQADLRMGALASGVAYYTSEVAALTSAEAGPTRWEQLAGEPFCVTAGHPYAAVITSRFGGIARGYDSAAQALIGLKLGECQAVVGDRKLLRQVAELPEWRRYNRLLPALNDIVLSLRIEASDAALQQRIERDLSSEPGQKALADVTQHWIDEVAFQAYVLADTLDCH